MSGPIARPPPDLGREIMGATPRSWRSSRSAPVPVERADADELQERAGTVARAIPRN